MIFRTPMADYAALISPAPSHDTIFARALSSLPALGIAFIEEAVARSK
jgi:hypothetical protein